MIHTCVCLCEEYAGRLPPPPIVGVYMELGLENPGDVVPFFYDLHSVCVFRKCPFLQGGKSKLILYIRS